MEHDKVLQVNLLDEFIENFSFKRREHFEPKILSLFKSLEDSELTQNEKETLYELKAKFDKKLNKKREPLKELREKNLETAFQKYQGLLFDIKTRFDYANAEVAIQDGLDLSEYVKEVIEEINEDLKEAHLFDDYRVQKIRDDLSQIYFQFSRDKLAELYLEMVDVFKVFKEVFEKTSS